MPGADRMPILTLSHVAVHFGGLVAIADLSLTVQPGALHGLIGPNGAGKTTAMNVISGLVRPSAGEMTFLGQQFVPHPNQLAARGLARSFQASAVVTTLTALENVLLGGHAATRAGIASCALRLPRATREEQALREHATAALEQVGYTAPLLARMSDLSTWQRRQIEIARALLSRPKLLLLDEPAAGLTAGEVGDLKSLLRQLAGDDNAIAILLIEHNVPLVFSLCDEVTAMTEGRDIAHGKPASVREHPDVVRSYLGGSTHPTAPPPRAAATPAEALLKLHRVSAGYGSTTALHAIDFEVRIGETLALFGPNGAGKTTLLNTIVGERRATTGTITLQGQRIERLAMQAIIRRGIGIVPQGRAVMERQSVTDNLVISTTGLRLKGHERRDRLDQIFTQFPSLARRRRSLGASLSGGERQMLAIARALIRRPLLLLLDEPSIGLAPTIVDEMQRIVADLSAQGLTVVIGEQSVHWVLPIAHRAYAIAAGRIVAEGPPASLSDADALAARYLGDQPLAQAEGAL
jgi:ABC-type branched-subunit amino acid transport system ATPase component